MKSSRFITTVKNDVMMMVVFWATLVFVNTVRSQVTADFEANPTTIFAGQYVHFTDKSTNNTAQWDWSFDGGNPSTANTQGPHDVQYNSAGSFSVTLTVSTPGLGSDTKTGYITVYEPDMDFGDAPDGGMFAYNTLLFNNGARHLFSDQVYLGAGVDAEPDGQPNSNATGDDLTNGDEDGVLIPTLMVGRKEDIQVTVHGSGWLLGWIDFNINGQWDHPEEYILEVQLPEGIHTLEVNVPPYVIGGTTFARFRFTSDDTKIGYLGPGGEGEVEDYEVTIEAYDFGDAPDPTYPTLFVNDGARHLFFNLLGALYLGSDVDFESDGQPDMYAYGDDNDGNDDEDGLKYISSINAGGTATLTVEASVGGGYLNAWIDFNNDGDWDDSNEQVFVDQPLTNGDNDLSYSVPFPADTGNTFSRFRLSTMQGLGTDGSAPDGEVEDYMVVISADDFGDAPDPPYPTLRVNGNNGASHRIGPLKSPGPRLGWELDPDPNGQPDDDAKGDDNDGNDDEDGVFFISPLVPGYLAGVKVIASQSSKLNAWIDFNGDDFWHPSMERIFNDEDLAAGDNYLAYAVPASATPKETFARFRINSSGGLSPTGSAKNGEVEDYQVTIYEKLDSLDYGDAPDPMYPTLMASGGAAHVPDPHVFLGSIVDGELDGQPGPDALGDDLSDQDDEDGVIFMTPLIPGNTAHVQITTKTGYLYGWVDFNANGDWNDSGEKILFGFVQGGTYDFTFNVPMGVTTGSTFARFRLSSVANLIPTGIAPDGEVEDYKVTIEELVEGAIKWFQPPLKNPKSPYPGSYWGWDEVSIYGNHIIGDDWFCHDDRPVTNIHWWGSYAEWDSIVPPPEAPSSFHIGIWTDDPRTEDQSWSHPGKMLHDWRIERSQLNEHVVGSDFVTNRMTKPDTCFRYDFNIPQGDWFYQEGDSTVYWLTISALYDTIPDSYRWGWKARDRYFNGDAVGIISPKNPEPDSVFHKGEVVAEGWDMCFILTTTEYAESFDFGDAPDPGYPTMFASNGAHHILWSGQSLGSIIDPEDDGKQDFNAMGDDNDGTDDEDGVVFLTDLLKDQAAMIQVTPSVDGFLNAWIDFDGDGDWDGSDEQIFIDQAVTPGIQVLTFNVPDQAVTTKTFARFRFSPMSGVGYKGLVVGGEVEDYEVPIVTEVEEESDAMQIPTEFKLFQNSPNPFNPRTEIRYQLPRIAQVRLAIYNLSGQGVRVLVDDQESAGIHSVVWDARDNEGREVPAGIYIYRMKTAGFTHSKKLLLVK